MKQNKQGALVWVRCVQFPDKEQKQLHERSQWREREEKSKNQFYLLTVP